MSFTNEKLIKVIKELSEVNLTQEDNLRNSIRVFKDFIKLFDTKELTKEQRELVDEVKEVLILQNQNETDNKELDEEIKKILWNEC